MVKRLLIRRKGYKRKAYKRKTYTRDAHNRTTKSGKLVRIGPAVVRSTRVAGARVKPTSFKIRDTGEPGRTPKAKRWFKPKRRTGWAKDETKSVRRARLLAATDRRLTMRARYVQAGRMAQQLANVTTDKDTERRARFDAMYFFRKVD